MPTQIAWTDERWNPVTGCTPISSGCQNCYAKRMANRLRGRYGYPADDPFRVTFHPDRLEIPLRWKKPRRVFVDSMGDLFHEDVPRGWLFHVFDVMANAKQHIFQVLTKRPENIQPKLYEGQPRYFSEGDYLPNVHLGTSVENQVMANQRIPHLLECLADVRFISFEPLLGPVDAWTWLPDQDADQDTSAAAICRGELPGINWAIIGCESGHNRRPFKNEWAKDLAEQCARARVPAFVKQLRDDNNNVVRGPDEWSDWPEWATQDFPERKESES